MYREHLRFGAFLVAISCATHAHAADEWLQYKDVEKAGWSAPDLDRARKFAKSIGSAAVFVVDHGRVVAAWGAIDHPFKAASIRKSVYDATIGAEHLVNPFDVNSTMGSLGIDDIEPLTATEKSATLEQLLTARSGVYHPAAFETRSNANRRPQRGSAAPGTSWYYNNWDFNASCEAFEKLTGKSMADAFSERLAGSLGMQDFQTQHVFNYFEPRLSRHPAVTFRLSARDLARIGQLYLQDGRWADKQIVAKEWVQRSTKPFTTFEAGHYRGEGNGYGRLWWVFPARPALNSAYETYDRIAARGAGGQIMVLFPELEVLVVHLADTDGNRGVPDRALAQLVDRIVGARSAEPAAACPLQPMKVEKISAKAPTPFQDQLVAVPKEKRDFLVGDYMTSPEQGIRLYVYDQRLFAQPLGTPLNDVELLLAPDGTLRSPVVSVVFTPGLETNGSIQTLQMTFRGRTNTGTRAK